MTSLLTQRAQTARDWMMDASFPLWATAGVHPEGGFYERLDLKGAPVLDADARVRVQARQTYTYALAHQFGWRERDSAELVQMGARILSTQCRRPDGLSGRRTALGRGLVDDTADLYDTAFSLLAFSTAARVFGEERFAREALNIAEAVETHLARTPDALGYRERLPAPAERSQNPHMHYLEACLVHADAGGGQTALARAQRIQSLMETKFRHPETGALRETFRADWVSADDDRYEAGHQYEWVWLLHEAARLTGTPPSQAIEDVYAAGLRLTEPDGRIYLSHTLEGAVREPVRRTWSLTEALKAHLARMEAGDGDAEARAAESFDALWADHLAPAIDGGWIDKYGADGAPVGDDMPASTGYHVYLAFAELIRVAGV